MTTIDNTDWSIKEIGDLIELGKTKTYIEMARQYAISPNTMHKFLTRHSIKFMTRKNNRSKKSVVKLRIRKGTQRTLEYYLTARTDDKKGFLYHEWYTIDELSELPECEIKSEALRARIRNIGKPKSKLKTLWQAVYLPIDERFAQVKHERKVTSGFVEFVNLMNLFPVGSLAKNIRY